MAVTSGVSLLVAGSVWCAAISWSWPRRHPTDRLLMRVTATCCAVVAVCEAIVFGWLGGWLPPVTVLALVGVPLLAGLITGLAGRFLVGRRRSPADLARTHQPGLVGGDDSLDPVAHAEFREQMADVGFDRGLRKEERC